VHLYHGSRRNRRYVERYQIFHENAYDPVRDVEIDAETGLLQWRSRHGSGSWFVEWLSISSSAERMNDAGGLDGGVGLACWRAVGCGRRAGDVVRRSR